jgi:hypothetical protein
MAPRRACTAKVKTHVVLDLLAGRRSLGHIGCEHELQEPVVTRWRAVFLERPGRALGVRHHECAAGARVQCYKVPAMGWYPSHTPRPIAR